MTMAHATMKQCTVSSAHSLLPMNFSAKDPIPRVSDNFCHDLFSWVLLWYRGRCVRVDQRMSSVIFRIVRVVHGSQSCRYHCIAKPSLVCEVPFWSYCSAMPRWYSAAKLFLIDYSHGTRHHEAAHGLNAECMDAHVLLCRENAASILMFLWLLLFPASRHVMMVLLYKSVDDIIQYVLHRADRP